MVGFLHGVGAGPGGTESVMGIAYFGVVLKVAPHYHQRRRRYRDGSGGGGGEEGRVGPSKNLPH